jgi:hypothetical protein
MPRKGFADMGVAVLVMLASAVSPRTFWRRLARMMANSLTVLTGTLSIS